MSNLRFEKNKFSKFLSGKGFYVALAVCLVAVGGVAWSAMNGFGVLTADDPSSSSRPIINWNSEAPAATVVSGIDGSSNPVSQYPLPPSEPESSAPATSVPAATTPTYMYPVGTDVMREFSNGELVYSETMKDWRTHNGVDFKADIGTIVKAIEAGTVKSVKTDALWGVTVIIEHGNGIVATYCGLGKTVPVKEGQAVTAGQEIGAVGEIPCEVSESAHLHLIVTRDEKTIDPLELFG